MSPDREVTLSLRGLRKSFGALQAVVDLSLDVHRGEVLGLLGPNGAGKTTTLRMVCGLLEADGGDVLVDGVSLGADVRTARRRIGLCPQELVIWETLTCLEQLVFLGTQYDLPRREARRRAHELLDVMGLSERAGTLARTLSGGMKRRLNLALALVHDPELLILDEPQAGLDAQSRVLVREYIQGLARDKTVLITTHDMDEADRMARRIAVIDHGRLLVLDTPAALKERHAGGEVVELSMEGDPGSVPPALAGALPGGLRSLPARPGTLRLAGPAVHRHVPHLVEHLRREGIAARDVVLRQPTLEDVFISLTGRGLRE